MDKHLTICCEPQLFTSFPFLSLGLNGTSKSWSQPSTGPQEAKNRKGGKEMRKGLSREDFNALLVVLVLLTTVITVASVAITMFAPRVLVVSLVVTYNMLLFLVAVALLKYLQIRHRPT